MKRLATLVLASSFVLGSVLSLGRAASATPFSDVPANHWAYQYIQSLAADGIIDGYPDGKFKGDRPLTRYEMAVVVARVIAKLQENQKTEPQVNYRPDIDKLQKLIDALKDELDSLGVRVTNLEDSLDALDKRTKFAQSLSMHGLFLPNVTFRQRTNIQRSIQNLTGATQATYYGQSIANNRTGSIDPFVNAFMSSDDSNNPLTQNGSGVQIRQDSRFSLAYQFSDNLTISLPVHILNFEYGGEYAQQAKVDIEPGIDINVAKAGAISNLHVKFGILDNMQSSRTGLAFRAPFGYSAAVPYELPLQPYQKGFAISGTLAETNFGSTSFFGSFSRMDQDLVNTQTANDLNVCPVGCSAYLFPITPPQAGFVQAGAAQALRTDNFNSGTGGLQQVYLTQKAVLGSVFVSFYNGTTYSNVGVATGGPANPLPAITYNDAYNSVVFGSPIPAGSTISITYRGVTATGNTGLQRYMANARLNQKFNGVAGLEIGATFNRIFDFDDTQTTGDLTQVFAAGGNGQPLVSDTVFGIDAVLPLPFLISGAGSNPVIFGEAAFSKYTPDFRNVAAIGDTAGVIGMRLKIQKIEFSVQYQSVGADFLDGAPFKYYGNPPPLFAFYHGTYFPDFYGFGNSLGINTQFDNQFTAVGQTATTTRLNPNLTFLYPVFNPLKGNSPTFYSAFTPNTRGTTATFNTPIRIGDVIFTTRGQYQHLEEIRPNSVGNLLYGPAYASTIPIKWDNYTLATAFSVPAFGQRISANLSGTYELLRRNDPTAFPYLPINLTTQTPDATAALASTQLPGGGTGVSFYPNFVNMKRYAFNAAAAVPLTRDVALNMSYSTQRYNGSYGTTLTQNISQRKDFATAAVVYNIPKTNSSVQFQARNYRYVDDVISNYNLTQNRQDVIFTIRF
ncbi:MAG: S-layer homology domain-containing protein [Candidatus Eremiobacteraeota bacterium]|nr:S-layer homology domain-containing protein [Candidatus Eremiobacteraeota bacterium]